MRAEAIAHGARFEYGMRVNEVVCGGPSPRILLESGKIVTADRVVVAAGAYSGKLLPGFFREGGQEMFLAQRRVLAWTEPSPEHRSRLAEFPVWGAFTPRGFFYGFPYNEEGIAGFKLACHEARAMPWMDEAVDPDALDRNASPRDLEPLEQFLDEYIPAARGPIVEIKACMYGSTPSWDFLIDAHPADSRVWVLSGFSGHGFKFATEVGELAADLVERGVSDRGLDIFTRKSHAPH